MIKIPQIEPDGVGKSNRYVITTSKIVNTKRFTTFAPIPSASRDLTKFTGLHKKIEISPDLIVCEILSAISDDLAVLSSKPIIKYTIISWNVKPPIVYSLKLATTAVPSATAVSHLT